MFDIPLAQRLWFPSATRTRLAETCQRSVWYYSHTDFWLGKNFNFNGVGRISADRTSSIQQNMSLYVQHIIIKLVKNLWEPTEETVDNIGYASHFSLLRLVLIQKGCIAIPRPEEFSVIAILRVDMWGGFWRKLQSNISLILRVWV